MNDDYELNKILKTRFIPPPSTNLAARIAASVAMHPKKSLFLIVMQEIAAMMIVPRPAYAVAFSLVLGLALGIQMDVSMDLWGDMFVQEWLSFADIEEGDWL